MIIENPYAVLRRECGITSMPDVSKGFFRVEDVFFHTFQKTGDAEQWLALATRKSGHVFSFKVTETHVAFRGRGDAWQEERGGHSYPCPPKIYNKLNACISLIAAIDH
jgi:hypothetical protein